MPAPGVLSSRILPPCACTMSRTMARPRPAPPISPGDPTCALQKRPPAVLLEEAAELRRARPVGQACLHPQARPAEPEAARAGRALPPSAARGGPRRRREARPGREARPAQARPDESAEIIQSTDGATASFFTELAPDEIRARIFERGVGETPSSGTSAVAVAAATHGEGDVVVHFPGGDLHVRLADGRATLFGRAERVV